MANERVERRRTAILTADIAGYSRLMGADEEGTLAQLKACRRELVDPKIAEHRGRIAPAFGREGDDKDTTVATLATHVAWVREHTRLGELARRWEEQGLGKGASLRGADLEAAERWLDRRPTAANAPTDLHQDFIRASRQAATARQRYWVGGSLVAALVAFALGGYAWTARNETQRVAAETARSEAPQVAQGNLPAALTSYQASLAIAERLAKSDPDNAGWQRDLAVSYDRVGDVQKAQRNLAAALVFREPMSPSSGFILRLQLSPPFDVINSTVFDTPDMRVRLAQALPVGRSDCTNNGGLRFACDLMGQAALQNFVQNQSLSCDRFFLPHGVRRAIVDAQCWLNGEDLAEHQIRAGFAFPSELAGDRHRQAMNEARSQHAGVWAGP